MAFRFIGGRLVEVEDNFLPPLFTPSGSTLTPSITPAPTVSLPVSPSYGVSLPAPTTVSGPTSARQVAQGVVDPEYKRFMQSLADARSRNVAAVSGTPDMIERRNQVSRSPEDEDLLGVGIDAEVRRRQRYRELLRREREREYQRWIENEKEWERIREEGRRGVPQRIIPEETLEERLRREGEENRRAREALGSGFLGTPTRVTPGRGTTIDASTSGTGSAESKAPGDYLLDYDVEIEPTKDKTYGPNTGRVQALIGAVTSMSPEASKLSGLAAHATWYSESSPAKKAAWQTSYRAIRRGTEPVATAAGRAALDAAWNVPGNNASYAAYHAAVAEVVSDKITPEAYRRLTDPMNVGLTYDRKVKELKDDPERQAAFKRAANSGGITTLEQVTQLGNMSTRELDYYMGTPKNSSFEQRVKVAKTLSKAQTSRTGTPDRIEGNQARAMAQAFGWETTEPEQQPSKDYLVDYGVEIKPTKDTKYGPNTGRVQAVIGAAGSLSPEAAKLSAVALAATGSGKYFSAKAAATDADGPWSSSQISSRDAWAAASADERQPARLAAADAARAEQVINHITPEQYRILTNPLNVGLTYDRKVKELEKDPERQAAFKRAINGGGITTPEQITQLGNMSTRELDYYMGTPKNSSFEQRVKAAKSLSRAQTSRVADRMENRAKAMGETK